MLSTNLHYSPAFNHFPPTDLGEPQYYHMNPHDSSASGFDSLSQPPHYALHQLHSGRHPGPPVKPYLKQQRQHPYANEALQSPARRQRDSMTNDRSRGTGSSGPVRRRISRACDQCNQLRTKCDGKNPCAHCVEFALTCEYVRERKKRGKASRKDIAAQAAAAAAAAQATSGETLQQSPTSANQSREENLSADGRTSDHFVKPEVTMGGHFTSQDSTGRTVGSTSMFSTSSAPSAAIGLAHSDRTGAHHHLLGPGESVGQVPTHQRQHSAVSDRNMQLMCPPDYEPVDDYQRSILPHPSGPPQNQVIHSGGMIPHSVVSPPGMQTYSDSGYSMLSPQSQQSPVPGFRMGAGESSMTGFLGTPVSGSPAWLPLPSPSTTMYPTSSHISAPQVLRYPVLRPLLPHLGGIVPMNLACDLLEIYFQSSSTAAKPTSPYVAAYVFRKQSFLRHTNPRVCTPALLASMLWVGAQTSESTLLTNPPSSRGTVRQKLLELTVSLLRPLVHSPSLQQENTPLFGSSASVNGVSLGSYGVQGSTGRFSDSEGTSTGMTGGVDDVMTYLHIATVLSASENKAASLRWWNAAWSLARELKLGREIPTNLASRAGPGEDTDADGEVDIELGMGSAQQHTSNMPNDGSRIHPTMSANNGTEEEREERRRVWWLLYIMDRHLALCYNRPLFLLDIECDRLLQPMDETLWQAGEYFDNAAAEAHDDPQSPFFRRRGPPCEFSGLGFFGYFLPLMTILGGIVDLNHAWNHPRFSLRLRSGTECEEQADDLIRQLETFQRSMQDFEARYSRMIADADPNTNEGGHHDAGSPSAQSIQSASRANELKVTVAYSTHLLHTFYILLNGKWDPISLLDDNDLWSQTQNFMTAISHAVSAAEALETILDHDPDLSFMPFFYGIYLLQSSFLLLLIAQKMQDKVHQSVVKACETILRAHEASVMTLDSEYQRNFRKVMRSTVQQVRGRLLEDEAETHRQCREALALYRWTGDGSGLAL